MMGRRMGRPGLVGTMARTAVVAGTATTVSNRVSRRQADRFAEKDEQQAAAQQQAAQQQAAQQQAAQQQAAPAAAASGDDLIAQLERLGALHQQGLLTDEEFAAAKASLLS